MAFSRTSAARSRESVSPCLRSFLCGSLPVAFCFISLWRLDLTDTHAFISLYLESDRHASDLPGLPAVVGVDGLKVEPLDPELKPGPGRAPRPIRGWGENRRSMGERTPGRFGGVSEYG